MPYQQLLVSGFATGCIYVLIAVGYSLIYRSTRTINFAQGPLLMVGGYLSYWLTATLGFSLVASYLVAIIATSAIVMGVEVAAFKPMYSRASGAILVIVSSIGLGLVVETTIQLLWGAQAISVRPAFTGSISVGGAVITVQQLAIIGCTAVVIGVLQVFFRSAFGRGMRAAAENRDVAALMGISAGRMATIAYGLGGALAALAGILIAPTTLLTPTGGTTVGLLGLVGAIVGGLGDLRGALVGGLAIGIIGSFASYIVGGGYSEIVVFSVLVVVLIARPGGVLGEEGQVTRV